LYLYLSSTLLTYRRQNRQHRAPTLNILFGQPNLPRCWPPATTDLKIGIKRHDLTVHGNVRFSVALVQRGRQRSDQPKSRSIAAAARSFPPGSTCE
jgi:hypothetical protein